MGTVESTSAPLHQGRDAPTRAREPTRQPQSQPPLHVPALDSERTDPPPQNAAARHPHWQKRCPTRVQHPLPAQPSSQQTVAQIVHPRRGAATPPLRAPPGTRCCRRAAPAHGSGPPPCGAHRACAGRGNAFPATARTRPTGADRRCRWIHCPPAGPRVARTCRPSRASCTPRARDDPLIAGWSARPRPGGRRHRWVRRPAPRCHSGVQRGIPPPPQTIGM
jgi:hypothetical protein